MRLAIAISLAIFFSGVGVVSAQEKKPATIKILLPEANYKEPVVTVEGLPTKSTGPVRTFTTPALEPGKVYSYKLEALLEPNNYTKITRPREVTFAAGQEVSVDMRIKDDKLDKIVVRWVPTPEDIVDKMADMAKIGKDDVVWDPGCGDAVMLIRPIKKLGARKGSASTSIRRWSKRRRKKLSRKEYPTRSLSARATSLTKPIWPTSRTPRSC